MPSVRSGPRPAMRLTLVAAVVTLFAACTPGTTTTSTGTASSGVSGSESGTETSSSGPTTTPVTTTEPDPDEFVPFRETTPDSADGKRVGLIGLNQASPFSELVTKSVREQLEIAGAELVYCDSEANAEVALGCARRFATQNLDAYLTFQPVAVAGQSICDAGPQDVPVIAIDSKQGDCEAARMGVNNDWVGYTAGVELGRYAEDLDCEYDALLVLTDSSLGEAAERRVAGITEGFASRCPGNPDALRVIDTPSQDMAFTEVGKTLATLPVAPEATGSASEGAPESPMTPSAPTAPETGTTGTASTENTENTGGSTASGTETTDGVPENRKVLVAGVTDAAVLGALAAAKAAGRPDAVDAVGLGASSTAHCEIAANPHWIGDVAFFPERYGEIAVPYLIDLLDGKSVPSELFIRSEFLTGDTLADHYDLSECPPAP